MSGRMRFVALRVLQTIPLLLGVTFLTFLIVKVTPGNPARTILGPRASDVEVAALSHRLGYDRGIVEQYLTYLGHLLHGDLGSSVTTGQPVTTVLSTHAGATLWLLAAGAVLTLALAVPLAAIGATRRDRGADHGIRLAGIVALYLPTFWVGFLLIRFVAIPTGWFPASGFGDSPTEHLRSVVLPGVALALALAPVLARSLRSSMIDVLDSDHVAAARSIGVRGPRLFKQYVLRNALAPTLNILAVQLGFLLFGVVVLEFTFDVHGIGSELVTAASGKNLPVIQGITLAFALAVVLVNLVADIVVGLLDPRVTLS